MNMSIRFMEPEERKYAYTQSSQIIAQTGCICNLRAALGDDDEFFPVQEAFYKNLKTKEFDFELQQIINTLRYGPIYVDRHNCIIQDHDVLMYDDGSSDEVFTLEDGSKGHLATNPDYLKRHPDAELKYTSLIANPAGEGLRKLHRAAIIGLSDPTLRQNSAFCGAILESRDALRKFCYNNPSASFGNNREWGIRVDTAQYSYLMRLNPAEGAHNLRCYCYTREWLDRHIQQARRGIRFITPHYEEKFRIPDGDQIRITTYRGENLDRTARYIDEYHVEIGTETMSNLYHICEFAEIMERNGNKVIPLRSSLPDLCYSALESTGEVILIVKGEEGYRKTDFSNSGYEKSREIADRSNKKLGVTKAQETAMSAGSMFGWDTKAADPASYNEQGVPQKKQRGRGDARWRIATT